MDYEDISDAELERLSPQELDELLAGLEAEREEKCRRDICFFAQSIEIPGTPPPMSEAQREKLRETSRRKDILDDDFTDDEDVAHYPTTVELAGHHEMILQSVDGMMSGEPLTGIVDGVEITAVPDGIMLFLPPGSAKSTYATVLAPAYVMGRYPGTDVISASYGAILAHRFARRVRHLVRDEYYSKVFRTAIVADNQAVNQWSLDNGSAYLATGILGAVTGFRADLLGIDDPIAGIEEADSDVIRDKTNSAILNDLFTRLKPGGKVMLTQTRWHEMDPAGALLGEKWKGQSGLWRGTDGRLWLVVNLPMLAEHADDPLGRAKGEQLWKGHFKPAEIERLRTGNQRTWSALYQQRPAASEGTVIYRDLWRCWPHGAAEPTDKQRATLVRDPQSILQPKDIYDCFLVYDTAFEESEQNDPSAMSAWGLFKHPTKGADGKEVIQTNLICFGGWSERVDAIDLIERVKADRIKYRPRIIVIEKRASGIQLIQELRQRRWEVYSWLPRGKAGNLGKPGRGRMAAYLMDGGTVWYMPNEATAKIIDQCVLLLGLQHVLRDLTVTCAIDVARRDDFEIPQDMLEPEEQDEEDERQIIAKSSTRTLYGGPTKTKQRSASTPARGYGRL